MSVKIETLFFHINLGYDGIEDDDVDEFFCGIIEWSHLKPGFSTKFSNPKSRHVELESNQEVHSNGGKN